MGENYFEHDNDYDLIEWEETPVDFEIHAGVVVQHRLENPEHITGRWSDPEEVR